jgi:hypothetical protein
MLANNPDVTFKKSSGASTGGTSGISQGTSYFDQQPTESLSDMMGDQTLPRDLESERNARDWEDREQGRGKYSFWAGHHNTGSTSTTTPTYQETGGGGGATDSESFKGEEGDYGDKEGTRSSGTAPGDTDAVDWTNVGYGQGPNTPGFTSHPVGNYNGVDVVIGRDGYPYLVAPDGSLQTVPTWAGPEFDAWVDQAIASAGGDAGAGGAQPGTGTTGGADGSPPATPPAEGQPGWQETDTFPTLPNGEPDFENMTPEQYMAWLQSASGVNTIQYGSDVWEGLPALQYAMGNMSRPDFRNVSNTPTEIPGLGITIPGVGDLNYTKLMELYETDPDGWKALESIFKSGNRNLVAELAMARDRALLGGAVPSSIIQT